MPRKIISPICFLKNKEDSDSVLEMIEAPANTSAKETVTEVTGTPPQKAATPKVDTVPKKSAFDFLMGKKKAQLNDSFRADSDSECIVLDTSRSVCESPKPKSPSAFFVLERKPKNGSAFNQQADRHSWMDFVNDPLFQAHEHQYNGM